MQFVDAASSFLMGCEPSQIRMQPEMFAKLCRKYKEQAMAARCPRKGILPLKAAINALRPTPDLLTPMHADLFQLCLLAKCYNAAASILEEDVLDVDPSKTAATPTDLYLYSYYGAMLCIGNKAWARALELLMQSLAAPTMVTNAIVLACFKKYVLVSLIHTGQMEPLPKYVAQRVRGMTELDARPYIELAKDYKSHSSTRLNKVVEQQAPIFAADGNMGLVKQVVASLTTRNIQRLTTTYLTLSLADIATQVGLPSAEAAEAHIMRMVASGEIFASISDSDGGMVRFLEDSQSYNTPATAVKLDATIQKCVKLSELVTAAHDAVAADKEYLKKVSMKERSRYEGVNEDFAGLAGAGAMFQP